MTTAVDSTKSSSVLAAYNSSSSASSNATGSDSSIDDVQNRFLTLLVAQMENQNPLNPLDNTEVTNQLAQMSTVRGIEQLNSKLSSLVDSLGDSQAVQASALIDKAVESDRHYADDAGEGEGPAAGPSGAGGPSGVAAPPPRRPAQTRPQDI